jgi:hypothetical protein
MLKKMSFYLSVIAVLGGMLMPNYSVKPRATKPIACVRMVEKLDFYFIN